MTKDYYTDQNLLYYKKNFALLKEKFPAVAQIVQPNIAPTISFLLSKDKSPTIAYKNILLHSKYNPLKEGCTFASVNNIAKGDTVFLYGLGLAYHIKPLLEAIGTTGTLYVVELNSDILSAACLIIDLSLLLKADNFHLLASTEEMTIAQQINTLIETLNQTPPHKKKIILHEPSFKCLPKKFSKIKNALDLLIIGKDTKFIFKDVMKENLKENLDIVLQNPGIQSLFGFLRHKPTLFIGAGPSLDQAIPYLQKMQTKAFYCCVDTAFPILLKFGITPDIVITVDPQPDSLRHFVKHLPNQQSTLLIFTPTACGTIVNQYNGPKLVVIKKDQALLQEVEMDLLAKGATIGGGSVSCIGLDILIRLQASPIILFGMDFSYPHMKAYCCNTADTDLFLTRCHKFNSLEMQHLKIITNRKIVFLKNKTGTQIPSHQNLYSYVKNMEQIVRLNPSLEYLNFLSDGVQINGIKNIYFEEELETFLKYPLVKKIPLAPKVPLDLWLKEKIITKILA